VTDSQERGLERLILFSDAVVAIALTLLILPLTDVEIEAGQTLVEVLRSNSGKLLAFGISFAVIARYWRVTTASSRTCGRTTGAC